MPYPSGRAVSAIDLACYYAPAWRYAIFDEILEAERAYPGLIQRATPVIKAVRAYPKIADAPVRRLLWNRYLTNVGGAAIVGLAISASLALLAPPRPVLDLTSIAIAVLLLTVCLGALPLHFNGEALLKDGWTQLIDGIQPAPRTPVEFLIGGIITFFRPDRDAQRMFASRPE